MLLHCIHYILVLALQGKSLGTLAQWLNALEKILNVINRKQVKRHYLKCLKLI